MTNQDAFKFKAGAATTDADATMALQFAGLDPTADYNAGTGACQFYEALISYILRDGIGLTQETEGGYTKVYDVAGKRQYAYGLAVESGCQSLIDKYNPNPKVRSRTNMW